MGQARKLKVCTSAVLALFLLYMILFAEREIKNIEQQMEHEKEDRSIKEQLQSRAIKQYNYSYLQSLSGYLSDIFDFKSRQYKDIERLQQLPQEEKDVILSFTQDQQWNIIVNTLFNLMDEDNDLSVTKNEYESFNNKMLNENKSYVKQINNLFSKISKNKKSFSADDLQDYMGGLQQLINQSFSTKASNSATSSSNKNQKRKNAEELLDIIEQGIKIHYKLTDKEKEKLSASRLNIFQNKEIINIGIKYQMGFFNSLTLIRTLISMIKRLNNFQKNINVNDEAEEWFTQELAQIDANLDGSSQNDDIKVDLDEFTVVSQRIYQLYMNYNGVKVNNNQDFKFYQGDNEDEFNDYF